MSCLLGEAAAQDVEDIWDYIAGDNPDAAERLVEALFHAFEMIDLHPGIGHTRRDLTHHRILFWPVGSYLVLYRCAADATEIVAVVHGGRDIPAFLTSRI